MNNLLRINDVIYHVLEKRYERILWINNNYTKAYTIDMEDNKLILYYRDIKELEVQIEKNEIVIDNDKYRVKVSTFESMSDAERKLIDMRWNVIKELANHEKEPDIFIGNNRAEMVNEVSKKLQISKPAIYQYLKLFWKNGKIKIGLQSDRSRCGGKGKQVKSEKKLGRPPTSKKSDGSSINLTEKDKMNFQTGIKRYVKPKRNISISKLYTSIIGDFYTEIVIEDGKLIKSEIKEKPSEHQFRNYYYKEFKRNNPAEYLIMTKGKKNYLNNHAPTLSNSKYETFGPGYRFEIDSTIPPIYLTNRILKNKGVGKPTVYIVADVFSTLIAGVYVGLHDASWEGASSALYNCTENKVEFCKRYGLTITEEEWPSTTLPRKLLADRGELAGDLPNNFQEGLNIEMEHTPSYIGRAKGLVEGLFKKNESEYIHLAPGTINSEYKKRGERDYRKDATLDIIEFTRIVLRAVIKHNNTTIKDYKPLQGMLDDDIHLTPVNIWNWGVKNISGNLQKFDDLTVKINLMREGFAQVTGSGIIFRDRRYSTEIATKEQWFVKAKNFKSWSVKIRYDSRNMDHIYIIDEENKRFIQCNLRPEEEVFYNRTIYELEEYSKWQYEKEKENKLKDRTLAIGTHVMIKYDCNQAKKDVAENRNKKDMIDYLKENRKFEIEKYDKQEALSTKENNESQYPKKSNKIQCEQDDSRSHFLDILKRNI